MPMPTVFSCFDFERTSRIANANREPQPDNVTKYTQNGVKIHVAELLSGSFRRCID